jgi:hypothetical protein
MKKLIAALLFISTSTWADDGIFSISGIENKIENFILNFNSQDFFGIKVGALNNYYVVEGPRGPPIFKGYLVDYYEIQTDIHTLNNPTHIGVAVTSNKSKWANDGIQYTRENIIFGATIWSKEPCLSNKRFYEVDRHLQEELGFTNIDRVNTTKSSNWLQYNYSKNNSRQRAEIYCDAVGEEQINVDYYNVDIAYKYMDKKSKKRVDEILIKAQKILDEAKRKGK